MLKKLMTLLFLLITSIFLLCCTVTERICVEGKKVLVAGSIIGIKTEDIVEWKEENKKTISTSAQNIGIITCIDKETNQYVAFAHAISSNNKILDLRNNKCYKANYISVEKASSNKIGKLKAVSNTNSEIGNILENTETGIRGQISDISIFDEEELKEFYIGTSYNIKNGDAQIYVNLDGKGLKEYNIIIDYINYFDKTKNIHVKVVDDELINKAGGIVKGMSGAPIVQNGKLIGAINCVSEEDPTDAYGIFADALF